MCYTGRCIYEDHMGNCILDREECVPNYPDDAACVRMELELEEDIKKANMLDTLKEIRKLAEVALCDANDVVQYGNWDTEEDADAIELIRDKLAEILKQACDAIEEEEKK